MFQKRLAPRANIPAHFWVFAHVVHGWAQFSFGGNQISVGWSEALLMAMCALFFLFPLVSTLFFVCATHLLLVVVEAPAVIDHWLLLAFGNVVLVADLLSRRSRKPGPWRYGDKLLAGLRGVVVCGYASAAFAKLNYDYLDPSVSCAIYLMELSAQHWQWLPLEGTFQYFWIYGSVVVESSVAVGLLFKQTRAAAVTLGVIFHLFLASTPYVLVHDFTMVLIAYWCAFVDHKHFATINDEFKKKLRLTDRTWITRFILAGFVPLGAMLAGLGVDSGVRHQFEFTACLVAAYGLVSAAWRGAAPQFGKPSRVGLVMMALTLANAATPYLGAKTLGSFTMFSNLRTEKATSNHLIAPSLRGLGRLDSLVRIVASEDAHLKEIAERGGSIPRAGLRDWIELTGAYATILIDGQEHGVGPSRNLHLLGPQSSWLSRKLFIYRGVSSEGPQYCSN